LFSAKIRLAANVCLIFQSTIYILNLNITNKMNKTLKSLILILILILTISVGAYAVEDKKTSDGEKQVKKYVTPKKTTSKKDESTKKSSGNKPVAKKSEDKKPKAEVKKEPEKKSETADEKSEKKPAPLKSKKIGEWNVVNSKEKNKSVCYMISYPTKKQGDYKKRGEPYALVTYRGAGSADITFVSGYEYRAGTDVDIKIDSKHEYKFFTTTDTPENAWAREATDDKEVIELMKESERLTAKGISKAGTFSLDSYSLSGFKTAYKEMVKNCK
jgi:invasion protein IalB